MSITVSAQKNTKFLSDQLQQSIVQALKASLGDEQELVIKVLDGNLTVDKLEPSGTKYTIRMTIDVYPKI